MLLSTSGTWLLENMLAGKGAIGNELRTRGNKTLKGTVRAGKDFQCHLIL